MSLYKHQVEGIEWLSKARGGILADDMGLGKSCQSIIAGQMQAGSKLVICPASLRLNWAREIKEWAGEDAIFDRVNPAGWAITNYDTIIPKKMVRKGPDGLPLTGPDGKVLKVEKPAKFMPVGVDTLIVDECHYAKNAKSSRTKAVLKLARGVQRVWLLTGTPVINRPAELWTLLHAIGHPITKSMDWFRFGLRYCNGYEGKWGWDFSGASNLQELHQKLNGYMLRRLKEDCLDLPAVIEEAPVLALTSAQRKEYDEVFDKYLLNLLALGDVERATGVELAQALVEFGLQQQLLSAWKIDALTDLIGSATVIFCKYKQSIDTIMEKFQELHPMRITGEETVAQRMAAVDAFQAGYCKLIVANYKAGGVGLNMTAADAVIHLDLCYTPADHDQARDRAVRIGQQQHVRNVYPVFQGTIDEDIIDLLKKKREVISKILHGEEATGVNILKDLLRLHLERSKIRSNI